MRLIPIIELCHYCPGMVTALGVSVGLTAAAIMSKGTIAQKERWGLPLLTLEKIGSWAITEPGSGSDAFGGMKSTARRDGGGYVLDGSKTFITNGPYADTTVFICKLEDGAEPRNRKVLSFILDKGMPGFTQSKPMRKMGLHSSPTGELFLEDVHAGRERLIGETEEAPARSGAKQTFSQERTGVVAMALGIVEQCLALSVDYARTRVAFGRPIGEFQLIQLKLAKMEVARMNLQNIVFRQIEMAAAGKPMSFAEASACKLYAAQAAMEGAPSRTAGKETALWAALIVVMTFVAYVPALQGGFVWDDDAYVTRNATLRDMEGLRRIWLEPTSFPQYYPLVFTTFWLEYHLWGLDPFGFHVTNVLLHASSAVLLWLLLRRLGVPGAWLAAAIFALHPVEAESVAWVTERKNVLSGLFYLAAFHAYWSFADGERSEERRVGK